MNAFCTRWGYCGYPGTLHTAVLFMALATSVFCGCGKSTRTRHSESQSIPDLVAKLPMFDGLGVESCSYTVDRSSVSGGLPSPSDVRLELRGWAVLSKEGMNTLRLSYEWKPVGREDVPQSLVALLPLGAVQVSQKLNRSFTHNKTYVHGFVVILEETEVKRVYFMATDLDHPIVQQ